MGSLHGSKRHDVLKGRFGAMKFQPLANEALVGYIIRFNLRGAVQPAALRVFIQTWKECTLTEAY